MSDDDPPSQPSQPSPASGPGPITAIALGAGVLGAVQPKINAVLGERLDSSVLASLVNFSTALVGVAVLLALRPQTRRRLRSIRDWPVPRWTFTAGLGGVLVVLAGAIAVETIGVAVFSVAFFAGQISAGLLVDRLGVGAGGARPIAADRVQAALLAVAAVAVSQLGRTVGDVVPLLVLLVFAAGATSAFQSAFNGRIAAAVEDPFAPTALNVSIGLLALVIVVVVGATTSTLDPPTWPSEPWLYAGGFLGVSIVLALATASAALGVFRTTVAMLAAQLTSAFVVDAILTGDPPTAGAMAGAGLIFLAVLRLGRYRPRRA